MKIISNIVFSRNRPLQLDAYLESLYRYFTPELINTYVIYKKEMFDEQYKLLFKRYRNCVVIKEQDFLHDFLKLLKTIDTKYILFGIDDVVYFDSVDFEVIDETFEKFSADIFGFSLRFNFETLRAGGDNANEITIANSSVYSIDWTKGKTSHSRYPFELCATVYRTSLVKKIISSSVNDNIIVNKLFRPSSSLIRLLGKAISTRSILKSFGFFYSPNTLESWNCRWCKHHFSQLPPSIYFQKLCASAIQVNLVNTTTNNYDESLNNPELTVEALNEKYKQGYRIDIAFLSKEKPKYTHSGADKFKLVITKVNNVN